MTETVPIPAYDGLALPGSALLLMSLAIIVFWIHIILAGSIVGGTAFVLLRRIFLRHRTELDRRLDIRIVRALPVFISLAITFGVGTLLFIQTLYGHYFYSANIFIGNFWMMSLGFLLIGFICIYLAGRYWQRVWVWFFLPLVPLCFLAIVYIFTNNAVLTMQPEYWLTFHRTPNLLRVPDAALWPRLLHHLGAALIFSGLAIAWIGRYRRPGDDVSAEGCSAHAIRAGLRWLLVGLMLQIIFGFSFLLTIPANLQKNLIAFGNFSSFAWWTAVVLAIVTAATAFKTIAQPTVKKWLYLTTLLPVVGVFGMLLGREQLRSGFLARPEAGSFNIYRSWQVQFQQSPLLMFAITLVVGLIFIAIMLIMILRHRPTPATPSAEHPEITTDE